jgi:hypothetical protein
MGNAAEKLIVAAPDPVAFVSVPLAEGKPTPEADNMVDDETVLLTVNVTELFVYVSPAVALADEILNNHKTVLD